MSSRRFRTNRPECFRQFLLIFSSFILVSFVFLLNKNTDDSHSSSRILQLQLLVIGHNASKSPYPVFLQKYAETRKRSSTKTPLILFWNPIYPPKNRRALPFKFSSAIFNCSSDDLPSGQDCIFTHNRSEISRANVVNIQYRLWFKRMLPKEAYSRPQEQIWAFHIWESPDYTYHWDWLKNRNAQRHLSEMKKFFNWTVTYRLDSTVPYVYGRFRPLTSPDFTRRSIDRLAKKSRNAIWMVSHCNTISHREEYVKEMTKTGFEVDVIGKCNNDGTANNAPIICQRTGHFSTSNECSRWIGSTYKFYLAFENSLCRDYVTEKFFRAASLDLIPVVMNGANMSAIAPHHSYIDAKDFKSPGELADYLKKVGSNAELYNSYFSWKSYYDVEETFEGMAFTKNLCRYCSIIHRHLTNPKTVIYDDIEDWWIKQGQCHEG